MQQLVKTVHAHEVSVPADSRRQANNGQSTIPWQTKIAQGQVKGGNDLSVARRHAVLVVFATQWHAVH